MNTTDRIIFEKPDLTDLTKEYTAFDMHFHSKYSDGINRIPTIAKRARQLNIGICITDHNEIKGAVELDKERNTLNIPGIEVTSKKGTHVLVYFYDIKNLKLFYENDVKPYMGKEIMSSLSLKMETIIENAKQYDSVVILPHPYSAFYTGVCNYNFPQKRLSRILDMADGVEVINAGNLNKWNLQCAVLGFNLNKSITGGSDGHSLGHMGKSVTYAECAKNRKSFLDAVKNRESKVIGKEINILRKMTSSGYKIKVGLKNYPHYIEKNIRYGYSMLNSKSKSMKDNVKKRVKRTLKKGPG